MLTYSTLHSRCRDSAGLFAGRVYTVRDHECLACRVWHGSCLLGDGWYDLLHGVSAARDRHLFACPRPTSAYFNLDGTALPWPRSLQVRLHECWPAGLVFQRSAAALTHRPPHLPGDPYYPHGEGPDGTLPPMDILSHSHSACLRHVSQGWWWSSWGCRAARCRCCHGKSARSHDG